MPSDVARGKRRRSSRLFPIPVGAWDTTPWGSNRPVQQQPAGEFTEPVGRVPHPPKIGLPADVSWRGEEGGRDAATHERIAFSGRRQGSYGTHVLACQTRVQWGDGSA